jgi:hypothetical protein
MTTNANYSNNTLRMMRFLMGFLLALALILVEIGIAQIFLDRDANCRERISSGRIVVDPHSVCTPEIGINLLNALSRGPFSSTRSEVSPIMAWVVSGISFGILGGILAQFPGRTAISIFFGLHLVAIILFTTIAYLSQYIL